MGSMDGGWGAWWGRWSGTEVTQPPGAFGMGCKTSGLRRDEAASDACAGVGGPRVPLARQQYQGPHAGSCL